MHKSFRGTLRLAIGALACGAQCALAGVISISAAVSTKVEGESLLVTVTVENRGDESAYNAQAEFSVLGQRIQTEKVEQLPVGKPVTFAKEIPLNIGTPGLYPLMTTVFYTDANQYPFSALAPHVFAHGVQGGPADLAGKMDALTLSTRGKLRVTLRNLTGSDVTATVRLVVPRDLAVREEQQEVAVPARAEQALRFAIENFSARGGSAYPVTAVAEYEKDGVHQTALVSGLVKIIERPRVMGLNYSVLAGVLVLLVAAFIAFQKFKK